MCEGTLENSQIFRSSRGAVTARPGPPLKSSKLAKSDSPGAVEALEPPKMTVWIFVQLTIVEASKNMRNVKS